MGVTSQIQGRWGECVKKMMDWLISDVRRYGAPVLPCPLLPNNEPMIPDCSGYVSAALKLYGALEKATGINATMMVTQDDFTNQLQQHGFQRLPFSPDALQPGDIYASVKHAEICETFGKAFSWGSNPPKYNQPVGRGASFYNSGYKYIWRLTDNNTPTTPPISSATQQQADAQSMEIECDEEPTGNTIETTQPIVSAGGSTSCKFGTPGNGGPILIGDSWAVGLQPHFLQSIPNSKSLAVGGKALVHGNQSFKANIIKGVSSNPKYFLVYGGYNSHMDNAGKKETVENCYIREMTEVVKAAGSIPVYICTLQNISSATRGKTSLPYYVGQLYDKVPAMNTAYYAVRDNTGCGLIDLSKYTPQWGDKYFTSEGVHPYSGYKVLWSWIYAELKALNLA